MKSYFIENKIRFDTSENKLVSLISGDELELSLVTSKLFELLLEYHGEVATREKIFTDIFNKFGANSTNNNLNQYILNIRKCLLSLGVDKEIVKTVPKIGFIIPAQVDIVVNKEQDEGVRDGKGIKNVYFFIFIITLTTLLLGIFWYEKNKLNALEWDRIRMMQSALKKETGPCQFRTIAVDNRPHEAFLNDVIKYTESNPILKCTDTLSVYYVFINHTDRSSYSYFILKCHPDLSGPANCISQYTSMGDGN